MGRGANTDIRACRVGRTGSRCRPIALRRLAPVKARWMWWQSANEPSTRPTNATDAASPKRGTCAHKHRTIHPTSRQRRMLRCAAHPPLDGSAPLTPTPGAAGLVGVRQPRPEHHQPAAAAPASHGAASAAAAAQDAAAFHWDATASRAELRCLSAPTSRAPRASSEHSGATLGVDGWRRPAR